MDFVCADKKKSLIICNVDGTYMFSKCSFHSKFIFILFLWRKFKPLLVDGILKITGKKMLKNVSVNQFFLASCRKFLLSTAWTVVELNLQDDVISLTKYQSLVKWSFALSYNLCQLNVTKLTDTNLRKYFMKG